ANGKQGADGDHQIEQRGGRFSARYVFCWVAHVAAMVILRARIAGRQPLHDAVEVSLPLCGRYSWFEEAKPADGAMLASFLSGVLRSPKRQIHFSGSPQEFPS